MSGRPLLSMNPLSMNSKHRIGLTIKMLSILPSSLDDPGEESYHSKTLRSLDYQL
jgi:hypothetical protein